VTSFNLNAREKSKDFARYFKEIEDRLAALERGNQLNNASIEGGSLDIYDEEGLYRGSFGLQPDGGVALAPVNTIPPPTPTAPTVASELAGLSIAWDGRWDDAEEAPSDFAQVQVHVGAVADYTPDLSTQVATITAPLGGSVTVHIPTYDVVWVRLVAQNTAALDGDPSAAVRGQARQAVPQDLIDGIITDVKLAESAVTQAKIALGAVGAAALADGAVLAEKLAKNSVTQAALAAGSVSLNALTGPLADSSSQRYVDTFRDATAWERLSGTGTWTINPDTTGTPSGGGLLTAAGDAQLAGKALIVHDTDTLYRVMIRVRATAQDSTGPAAIYLGAVGIADDGVTLVNRAGAASTSMHYYAAANGGTLATADGWRVYVGYIQGRAATGATAPAGPQTDPRLPGTTHADVRYLRPTAWLNFGKAATSVMEVDCFTIESLRTGVVNSTNLVTGSVTAAALAADSVIAGKVAADAITGREIAANSVTSQEIAAGSITAEKLTIVGGSNVLPDPSFEGSVTAALLLGLTYATQDKTKGNGSTASIKVDSRSTVATYRDVPLTLLPVLAGDQLHLAVDYYLSADWAGASLNIMARWEDAAGTILGYGVIGTSTPIREGWARLASTTTAPTNTTQASIRLQVAQVTAGDAWFDNAAVRPVVPGVQIADGSITAPKIVTGAVTADKILALAVTAEKIASLAVTTDKLNALAVTADKLAVNSVTATKIAAGSIEATHIKVGAITAEKLDAEAINGKIITGATIQTAASGRRVVLSGQRLTALDGVNQSVFLDPDYSNSFLAIRNPVPSLVFTSQDGTNEAFIQATGTGSTAVLRLNGGAGTPDIDDNRTRRWRTSMGNGEWATEYVDVLLGSNARNRLQLTREEAYFVGFDRVRVARVLRAGNIRTGTVAITPTPNVPTSVTVSGLGVAGTTYKAFVSANTAVPGTTVQGVGFTGVSDQGLTIWVTRTNNTTTTIDYMIVGED
jgi:hypothetical protein